MRRARAKAQFNGMMAAMRNNTTYAFIAAVLAVLAVLFIGAWYISPDKKEAQDSASAKAVVEQFGSQLKMVPLSGTPAAVREAIEQHYSAYVTPELLAQWLANPKLAPGRLTSSPSPDRIGVATVAEQGNGRIVSGEVIMVTSADSEGGSTDTVPFVAQVIPTENGWRIAAYEEETVQTLKNLPKTDEDIPGAR
jgi:hypothetical protein